MGLFTVFYSNGKFIAFVFPFVMLKLRGATERLNSSKS